MGKLTKLCTIMILFLAGTPWKVYAQSDYSAPIVVNDLVGEARFTAKTQNLMKISLIDNADGTLHKVLYYLTPNTSDVSLGQIKEDLSSQNIELDMMNMSIAEVDSELKEYQTNLGVFNKQLVSINIPLLNPSEVPVVGESGLELSSVTELAVLPSIVDGEVIISINFEDDNGTKLYTEHFLTYYDNNTDLLTMASDKFKENFPNYVYDLDKAYLSKNVSGDPEIIMTNLGEINAFSMEMTVPVRLEMTSNKEVSSEVMSTVEEKSTQSEKSSTEVTDSVKEKSIQSEKESNEANVSIEKEVFSDKASTQGEVLKKNHTKILPSTGETSTDIIVIVAGILLTLSVLFTGTKIFRGSKK